jgi:putative NIF3 family GTP cyclohydrolase 1 type 2
MYISIVFTFVCVYVTSDAHEHTYIYMQISNVYAIFLVHLEDERKTIMYQESFLHAFIYFFCIERCTLMVASEKL